MFRQISESFDTHVTKDAFLIKPGTGKPHNDFQVSFSYAHAPVAITDVRIHAVRHTYASLVTKNGVSLYEVQKLLGHSSTKMKQLYKHLNEYTFKQLVNTLPSF